MTSICDLECLKTFLDLSIDEFKNQLIINKVNEINCNFVDYIIKNSPKYLSYLEEYYIHFNSIDINIIKNTKNLQGEELIVYYYNIDTKNMDHRTIEHISNFIKTNKITNNIINLFKINTDKNNKLNQKDNNILSIKNDVDKNKQDIIDLKKDIHNIKNDIHNIKNDIDEKINKLFIILSPSINN